MTNTISATRAESYDAGLRAFMTGVYNRMFLAVAITGVLAYFASIEPLFSVFYAYNTKGKLTFTLLGYVAALSPLAIILMRSWIERIGNWVALWAISALFGISLGSIFVIYTGASIATTFFATTAAFGALSLWGYTTKRNLSGWGVFLLSALIGIIVVMLLNVFLLHSALMDTLISAAGVLVFAGFIAFDTQMTKNLYDPNTAVNESQRNQAHAALSLYLDFLNLFQFLLHFIGVRKD